MLQLERACRGSRIVRRKKTRKCEIRNRRRKVKRTRHYGIAILTLVPRHCAKNSDTGTGWFDKRISFKMSLQQYIISSRMSQSTSAAPVKTLQEWHSPSSRTEVIHELIHGVGGWNHSADLEKKIRADGVDRYNPTNLSYMEEYLQSQVQSGEYDLLAYLAILKLCAFHTSIPKLLR